MLLFLFSCKKGTDRFPYTEIGGHAGSGLHISSSNYHDNSLESYQYACSFEHIHWIELDVQLSADHTWWLFHDLDLSVESTGSGSISLCTDAYLSTVKYKSLEGEKLIRLVDLPSDLNGRTLLLDVKEVKGITNEIIDSASIVSSLLSIQNHFKNGSLALVSNGGRYVSTLKSAGFQVFLNSENAIDYLAFSDYIYTDGAVFRNTSVNSDDMEQMKMHGKKSIIYDVRSPKGIRSAFKKYPEVILADDIKATLIEKYK